MSENSNRWVNVAIVGCGRIYNDAHRRTYVDETTDNMVIIALCDWKEELVKAQFNWIKDQYETLSKNVQDSKKVEMYTYALEHLKYYTDYTTMLTALEKNKDHPILVDNCTHGVNHIPCSIEAMEHGFNAMAEKPPGMNFLDVKRVGDTEKKTGKFFQINENECYNPPVEAAREYIQKGEFGNVNTIIIKFGHRGPYVPNVIGKTGLPHFIDPELSGGGVLQDLAPHGISKALWPIYQEGTKVVSCKTSSVERRQNPRKMTGKLFESPVDDYVISSVIIYDPRTDKEIMMDITSSWCGGFPKGCRIFTDKGELRVNKLQRKGIFKKPIEYKLEADKYHPNWSHTREAQNFADKILEGRPANANGAYALLLQEVLSIQYFSKLMKREVTLKEMYEWGEKIMKKYDNEQEGIVAVSLELLKSVDLL